MTYFLKTTRGPEVGRLFRLEEGDTQIGRTRTISLSGSDVDATHAWVSVSYNEPATVVIEDLGSDTGTFVNGKKVKSSPLRVGDQVRIGHWTLELLVDESSSNAVQEDAPGAPTPLMQPTAPRSVSRNVMARLKCSECGSTEFDELASGRVRCRYCQTLYQTSPAPSAPAVAHGAGQPIVHIMKGANILFGKSAHIVVNGGLEIDEGAHVEVDGSLEVVERGSAEVIQSARERLARGNPSGGENNE